MLNNIHSHWIRSRVCKIKCRGVCTVDMDNVCQQLEVRFSYYLIWVFGYCYLISKLCPSFMVWQERTGGKIIYRGGGMLYLFRGRNYDYRTRPRFPLMLWKPASPVYPRLVERAPEGLTLEEASEMRKKGRILIPICKLGRGLFLFVLK